MRTEDRTSQRTGRTGTIGPIGLVDGSVRSLVLSRFEGLDLKGLHGPILSGWSAVSWFLVLLIVTLWGFLGRGHCVGGGVLLVLFGCRLSACSQDVVSFIEIEIKNAKEKKMHQGVGGETPSPVSPSHHRLPCHRQRLLALLLLVSFGLLALLWLLWLVSVIVAIVLGGGGVGVGCGCPHCCVEAVASEGVVVVVVVVNIDVDAAVQHMDKFAKLSS